jgi:hypothetical protein
VTWNRAEVNFFIQGVHHFLRILPNIILFLQYIRLLRNFATFLQDLTFFIVTSVKKFIFYTPLKGSIKRLSFSDLHSLGYYAACNGDLLPNFHENLSVPLSRIKNPRRFLPLTMGPISCPETSVTNYHSALRNRPEELRSLLFRGGSLKSRLPVLYQSHCN